MFLEESKTDKVIQEVTVLLFKLVFLCVGGVFLLAATSFHNQPLLAALKNA